MSRAARLLALLALVLHTGACATPTAADRERAIQTALDAGRAACLILLADRSIEREPGTDAYCAVVLNGCPGP